MAKKKKVAADANTQGKTKAHVEADDQELEHVRKKKGVSEFVKKKTAERVESVGGVVQTAKSKEEKLDSILHRHLRPKNHGYGSVAPRKG